MPVRLLLAFICVATLPACTDDDTLARPTPVATSSTPTPVATPSTPAPVAPPAAAATPEVDLAALGELLRRCRGEGGHPLGTAASAERLGTWGDEPVFQVRMTADATKPVLLFEGPDSECPAFVLGAPATSVTGDFLGDGTQSTIAALSQAADGVNCDDDACPVALLLRDASDVLLAAVRPHASCETITLKRVRLFDRVDSLELRCTAGDSDRVEKIQLLYVFDRAPRPLLAFDAALTSSQTQGEDRVCTYRSAGGYTIKKRGAAPVLDVIEVTDLKEGIRGEWAFVPAQQRLVAGERRREKLPAPGSCE